MNIFCERLKILREAKGLTQKQAGEAIGISESQYSDLERSKRPIPKADRLVAIADLFGTSIDYLVGRTDERYIAKK